MGRHSRSAENVEEKKDGLFALIRSMDTLECGKGLICELETKAQDELEADEALILSLFGDRKFKKQVNPASAKAEYDLAAELGLASKSQVICRQRYASCPYSMDEMMKALRNSHQNRSYSPESLSRYTKYLPIFITSLVVCYQGIGKYLEIIIGIGKYLEIVSCCKSARKSMN